MAEVRQFLESAIQGVDIALHIPPYLPTFYHPLRTKIFKNFLPLRQEMTRIQKNKTLYQFIQIVDEEMLNLFQMQLSQPYQELIMTKHYGIPRELNVEKMQKENKTLLALQNLVHNISEWNIQIERSVDSIARVSLYDLWNPSQKEQLVQLNAELKALLTPQDDFNYSEFTKHILLNMLSQGAEKFSKFLYTSGISESNLSFGAVLLIYHSLVGSSALPWQVILPQVNLKWLFGGMVGSLVLGRVSTYLDMYDELEQIYGVTKVFKEITMNLVEFNENLIVAINECLLTATEEDETNKRDCLKSIVDQFLACPESVKDSDCVLITADCMRQHEEDEWQILDLKKSDSNNVQNCG